MYKLNPFLYGDKKIYNSTYLIYQKLMFQMLAFLATICRAYMVLGSTFKILYDFFLFSRFLINFEYQLVSRNFYGLQGGKEDCLRMFPDKEYLTPFVNMSLYPPLTLRFTLTRSCFDLGLQPTCFNLSLTSEFKIKCFDATRRLLLALLFYCL